MNYSLEKKDVKEALSDIVDTYAHKFDGEDNMFDILAPDGIISENLTVYIMNRVGLSKTDLKAKYYDLRDKDFQIIYEDIISRIQEKLQDMHLFPSE